MELRAIVLSLVADIVAAITIAAALLALYVAGHANGEQSSILFELVGMLPAIALGITSGFISKSKPVQNAAIATILSCALVTTVMFGMVHFFNVEQQPSLKELILDYAAPLVVSIFTAYFTFSARQRPNKACRGRAEIT